MEHEEAIHLHAAERYVARELSPAERDAFEAHFFDCTECAENVRFELTFAANARAVLREPAAGGAKWRHWFRLRPALAFSYAGNLVLAAALVFFLLTGTREPATQPRFTRVYFAPGPAHGVEDVHSLAAGDTAYVVRFLGPTQKSPTYFYEILDAAGKRERSGSLPSPDSQEENLYLQVPVKGLRDGVHTLEVHAGGPGSEMVSRSRFQTAH